MAKSDPDPEEQKETGDEESKEKKDLKKKNGPPWVILAIFLGIAIVVLALFGWSVSSAPLLLVELLLAVASICVGGFFGFLFGMPKASDPLPKKPGETSTKSFNPSTNLEQISDWLTKILIGVGLIEIRELGSLLRSIVDIVVGSLREPPAGTEIITYAVIITFILFGFIASFLWTRIYYGLIQAMADKSVNLELREELEETKQEVKDAKQEFEEKAIDLSRRMKAVAQRALNQEESPEERTAEEGSDPSEEEQPEKTLPKDILDRIEKFKKAEDFWNTNPTASLFPNATPERNGFRLDGKIMTESTSYLEIQLTVTRSDNNDIEDEVIFLLHPTFGKSVRYEKPRDGIVKLTIRSAGWFTVVAIINETEPTVLSYDLRELANVPQWFKES